MGIEQERRVLIVAPRSMAESLLRELTVHPSEFRPIGFVIVDGDPTARRIQGVPVLGRLPDFERILARGPVSEVFVALPANEPEAIHQTVRACRRARVGFRMISSVRDVLDRPRVVEGINLEELFELETVEAAADSARWAPLFENKVVLLLGAAGMLGS
jgi:FlaA1/EpsC-like NDP-sugar epimerase